MQVTEGLARARSNQYGGCLDQASAWPTHWLPFVKLGVVVGAPVPLNCAMIESKQWAHMAGSVITSSSSDRLRGMPGASLRVSDFLGCAGDEAAREKLRPIALHLLSLQPIAERLRLDHRLPG